MFSYSTEFAVLTTNKTVTAHQKGLFYLPLYTAIQYNCLMQTKQETATEWTTSNYMHHSAYICILSKIILMATFNVYLD